jgi:cytochrome P450
MTEYIKDLANKRRENMGEDLLSILLSMSDGNECPVPHHTSGQMIREAPAVSTLTEEELVANINILLSTGHETTTHLIGNGILAFLQHSDQMKLLKDNPELIDSAIDEILRYDNPVQITYRSALEDTEIKGKLIRKGDLVNTVLGSANRDPERFSHPDTFDITRSEGRHLSFGLGIHYCIGAPLVKLEAEIAFETILRRFPNLKLKSDILEWQEHPIFRGLKRLQVAL